MSDRTARILVRDLPSVLARGPQNGFERRIEYFSRLFLGRRYADDPVGDGRNSAFDKRPMVRLDAFDCQTYVETVLALSSAHSVREFREELIRLRYREARVDFAHRNHYLTLQWIPANLGNWRLRDITAGVAGEWPCESITRRLDMERWFATLDAKRIHGAEPGALSLLRASWTGPRVLSKTIRWLPLRHIIRGDQPFRGGAKIRGLHVNTALLARIPRSAVLVLGSDTYIHLGLVVRSRGKLVFRQASRVRGLIVEHELSALLMMLARFSFANGIVILQPLTS